MSFIFHYTNFCMDSVSSVRLNNARDLGQVFGRSFLFSSSVKIFARGIEDDQLVRAGSTVSVTVQMTALFVVCGVCVCRGGGSEF